MFHVCSCMLVSWNKIQLSLQLNTFNKHRTNTSSLSSWGLFNCLCKLLTACWDFEVNVWLSSPQFIWLTLMKPESRVERRTDKGENKWSRVNLMRGICASWYKNESGQWQSVKQSWWLQLQLCRDYKSSEAQPNATFQSNHISFTIAVFYPNVQTEDLCCTCITLIVFTSRFFFHMSWLRPRLCR